MKLQSSIKRYYTPKSLKSTSLPNDKRRRIKLQSKIVKKEKSNPVKERWNLLINKLNIFKTLLKEKLRNFQNLTIKTKIVSIHPTNCDCIRCGPCLRLRLYPKNKKPVQRIIQMEVASDDVWINKEVKLGKLKFEKEEIFKYIIFLMERK